MCFVAVFVLFVSSDATPFFGFFNVLRIFGCRTTETRTDEYGVEEQVQVKRPGMFFP